MLKYHVRTGTLFTLEDKRPTQQYYPTAIKSNIIEKKQKSTRRYPSEQLRKPFLYGSAKLISL